MTDDYLLSLRFPNPYPKITAIQEIEIRYNQNYRNYLYSTIQNISAVLPLQNLQLYFYYLNNLLSWIGMKKEFGSASLIFNW